MIPDDYTVVDYKGKVLNKNDVIECIEELRQLVFANNDLKTIRTDNEYLFRFLHCTKFNVAGAFKRVNKFHDIVRKNSDWFISVSPSERQQQLQAHSKGILQSRDKQGRSIYFMKLGKVDTSTSDPKSELQLDEMWFESALNDLQTQETGICIIVDMNGFSWRLLRWLTPGNVKFVNRVIQTYPCKEFVFHVVNTSILFNAGIRLIWPFLNGDIKKQVKFHFDNFCSLQKHIDSEALPPEYGGCGAEIDFEKITKWFLDQNDRIRKCLEYRRTFETIL